MKAIPVRLVPEGVSLINDLPMNMYGGQITPLRAWVIPGGHMVFSMIDEDGKIFLAKFDINSLKDATDAGQSLLAGPRN